MEISKEFNNGKFGISTTCLNWLRNHVQGQLLQFGRLQFHLIMLSGAFRVYRRSVDGKYMILAEPGMRFTPDGYHDGVGEKLSFDAWSSDWREKDGIVLATEIGSEGRAHKKSVTFKLNEWELIANKDSAVLNIHIPRGSRIQMSDWQNSIKQAFEYFEKQSYLPKPVACVCRSWIFDPRLQEILPEKSGLVSLQKRLRLFPFVSPLGTRSGFYFVFGDDDIDLKVAARDTSLRRAMLDYVKNGGVFTGGGMIIFKDEIEQRFSIDT
ncbi:MAG: hypothetical protein U9O87_09925 [Verrucomicrobiota bacterium]|nr:hypothetical protein [Verrucomicrobiota bacterium]